MPRVSVIVPVYNSREYLGPCVESVLNQSYADFELILIDDGSTDGCAEMCDRFASSDHRVRCVHMKNSGVSAARNLGLSFATGEYVTFVDSDDMLLPNALQIISEYLNEAEIDLLQFSLTRNQKNIVKSTPVMTPKNYLAGDFCQVCAGGSVIRLALIDDNSIVFDKSMALAEDQIFIMRVINHASKVRRISDVLYFYRDNNNSATHRPDYDKVWNSANKLLNFKIHNPWFADIVDRTLLSFNYLLTILVNEDELDRLEEFYGQCGINNANGVNRGVKLFYYLCKIDFMLSAKIIRLLKMNI